MPSVVRTLRRRRRKEKDTYDRDGGTGFSVDQERRRGGRLDPLVQTYTRRRSGVQFEVHHRT